MLELKSTLSSSRLLPHQGPRRANATITDLPPEILDHVLQHLYQKCGRRLHSIIPLSRTNRHLRNSSLPLLFESVSCVVQNKQRDGVHNSFHKLVSQPHLLHHAKSLSLREPVLLTKSCEDVRVGQNHQNDLAVIEHALKHMWQLQRVRLVCSLATATQVLQILRDRNEVVIIVDHVRTSYPVNPNEDKALFIELLRDRTVALGRVDFPIPWLVPNDAPGSLPITRVLAINLSTGSMLHRRPFKDHPQDHSSPALLNTSFDFGELWLGQVESNQGHVSWSDLLNIVHWSQLRRLRVDGPHLQRRLHDVSSKMQSLEELHLGAIKSTIFHANCTYSRPRIWSDVNYPFFDADFACLPKLRVLEINGICNHVPIQNVAAASLKALRLHKPDNRSSVINSESQRSPSDLAILAKTAPFIERLELDIGYVESLWHPTAVPGVDVDPEQYRFLSTLSHFRSLRVLRLFPPYVAKEFMHSPHEYGFRQPLSDEQAVRMFNYIRSVCPKLELFSISVSALAIASDVDFDPMNWELRPWGQKTLVTTRQFGKDYELRQVWVESEGLPWKQKSMHTGRSMLWIQRNGC